jgi:hypothetical protein
MDNKEKFLRVIDTSCTEVSGDRKHAVFLNGELVEVVFKYGKENILPLELALKFVQTGFEVQELADGYKITIPAIPTDNVAAQLANDECVAKFTELTLQSLKVRAAQRKGGEMFLNLEDADKPLIISFLEGRAPEPELEDDSTSTADAAALVALVASDEVADEVDLSAGTPVTLDTPVVAAPVTDAPVVTDAPAADEQAHVMMDRIAAYFTQTVPGSEIVLAGERDDGVVLYSVLDADKEVFVTGSLLDLNMISLQVQAESFSEVKLPE